MGAAGWLALVVLAAVAGSLTWLLHACRRANLTDWGVGWMNLLDGLNRLYCRHFHRLADVRLYLPETGPAIVVSNHVSGLDPLLLIAASPRPLRFLIAREQYSRFGLTWLFRATGCIPVDRDSRPERAMRAALEQLNNGEVVALFPHGKIHLDTDPPRRLKAGAVRLAQLTGSSIFPFRISGIRCQGHVIRPLFCRSRVVLDALPALEIAESDVHGVLDELATTLLGHSGSCSV